MRSPACILVRFSLTSCSSLPSCVPSVESRAEASATQSFCYTNLICPNHPQTTISHSSFHMWSPFVPLDKARSWNGVRHTCSLYPRTAVRPGGGSSSLGPGLCRSCPQPSRAPLSQWANQNPAASLFEPPLPGASRKGMYLPREDCSLLPQSLLLASSCKMNFLMGKSL